MAMSRRVVRAPAEWPLEFKPAANRLMGLLADFSRGLPESQQRFFLDALMVYVCSAAEQISDNPGALFARFADHVEQAFGVDLIELADSIAATPKQPNDPKDVN